MGRVKREKIKRRKVKREMINKMREVKRKCTK